MFRHVFLALLSVFLFVFDGFCDDDSFDDRNRMVSRRNERFYKPDITRHFIALSGEYESDEDSKQRILKVDHFYKSRRLISDIELRMETLHENVSRDSDTAANKQHLSKESDEYRAIIAEKVVLFDSDNYFILFNETRYDDEADSSYYDIVTAAGFGRMFFDDRLEIDIAYGRAKAKGVTSTPHKSARIDYHRDIWVPSFRTEFAIFDDIMFVQRGFAYFSGDIDNYYLNTRIQYPLSQRVYLQFSHIFDKTSYAKYDNKNSANSTRKINETRRQFLLGLRFDFGRR